MKVLLIIISFIMITNSKPVHQDTLLKIDQYGNIIGLPKEYGPAKFDLDKKYLKIKSKEIVFPKCMDYCFNIHDKSELKLTASWYHSKERLPSYINFEMSPKNKVNGYTILINLETLELIHVKRFLKKESSVSYTTIELDNSCIEEYNKSIMVVKKEK